MADKRRELLRLLLLALQDVVRTMMQKEFSSGKVKTLVCMFSRRKKV